MGYSLKQSQTARPLLFKLRQSADHVSALTGASPTVVISKNGASFATPAGAVTEVGSGWYQVAANATDTNTLGALLLFATAGSADPTDEVFEIVAYDPDQVRVGASDGTDVTLAASQPNYAPLLAASYTAPDNAGIASIKAKTDNLPSDPADQSLLVAATEAILTAVGDVPNNAEFEARTLVAASYGTAANQTTILARLGAWTGTGVNTILGAFRSLLSKSASNPSDIGGTFDAATDSTEAIRDRGDAAWTTGSGGSGTGTGARTVTVTVNDGSTVLQNARVRLTEGANTFTGLTNASGVVTFNLDDASYVVSITKSGYSYAGTTLVVDDDKVQTYSMTAVSITPGGDAGEVTGYFTVRDEVNNAESGVTIYCRMLGIDDSSTGDAHDGANRTEVSAGNGLVQFEGLLIGGTYEFWRVSDSAARKVTIPGTTETQAGTYALPDIIGGS